MSWYLTEDNPEQLNSTVNNRTLDFLNKPIIIYHFIDITCTDSWSFEPFIKKLLMEYGMFFTVRPIICHDPLRSNTVNRHKKTHSHLTECSTIFNRPNPLLGVKAAGLQGNKAGRSFLRKIQEAFFLKQKDIYEEKVLLDCAKSSGLDVDEFKNDLYSLPARKAYQCDMKIANEMGVNQLPTLVFFSQIIEDHTVKVSGIQTYETYVYLLNKMVKQDLKPSKKPSIEDYLKHSQMVDINELAIIYDLSVEEATVKLKKLKLKRKVEKVVIKDRQFWSYTP